MQQAFDAMNVLYSQLTELFDEDRILLSLRGQLDERFDRCEWVADFMGKPAGHDFQRTESVCPSHQRG